MLRKTKQLAIIMLTMLLLSGCLYPGKGGGSASIDPQQFVLSIQTAVDRYRESTQGLLPIKNSDIDTPLYEKYIIDFKRLVGRGYINEIPDNAYENGGVNYYVLVDAEDEPKVKLLNLTSLQIVRDVERLIKDYKDKHHGEIPAGESIYDEWYTIDFEQLKVKNNQVKSVYSSQYLGLLVHSSGRVAIDYASEIMQILTRLNISEVADDIDLRHYLVDHSYYVPAGSQPYYWRNNEPVMIAEIN